MALEAEGIVSRDPLTVVMLGEPGFGNAVLDALLASTQVRVGAVFTTRYEKPFPYYELPQLADVCIRRHVVCHEGVKVSSEQGVRLLRAARPDLVIVATFKQILTREVIELPPLGTVNLHPSLLPKYRGACPSSAALLNGDEVTGVTAHYVTEHVDRGDILLQRAIEIGDEENDGQLRLRLAGAAAGLIPELVSMFAGHRRPQGRPQANEPASQAPRRKAEDGQLDPSLGIDLIRRKMRALNPLPGTSIEVGGRWVAVSRFALLADSRAVGVYDSAAAVDVVTDTGAIRLLKSEGGVSPSRP